MSDEFEKKSTLEIRFQEIENENELLIQQLHHLQEELERYYLHNQTVDNINPTISSNLNCVDDEFADVYADNLKLNALVSGMRLTNKLESKYALNVKIGNIIIHGLDSIKSFLFVPVKLFMIWNVTNIKKSNHKLGGNDFKRVIEKYTQGGFAEVDKLLFEFSDSPTLLANAYTSLARSLMNDDLINAAEAARRAYCNEPKAYRLKWFAFRLHEAGEITEAEAMLDLLPPETKFSDSENSQANQLRYEAKRYRQLQALKNTCFYERKAKIEQKFNIAVKERDEQIKLAIDLEKKLNIAVKERDEQIKLAIELEKKLNIANKERDEQTKLALKRESEITIRQESIEEEIARAESHIQIIKDIFFREIENEFTKNN